MDDQELELFLEKSKKKFTSGNSKGTLKKVFDKTNHIDSKILYDFFGKVLLEKPNLLKNSYKKLLKSYNDLTTYIAEKINSKQVKSFSIMEMEKYFLEKYCLFEDEKILLFFYGKVRFQKVANEVLGTTFITKYRIIVFGSPLGGGRVPFIAGAGLFFNLTSLIQNKAMYGSLRHSPTKAVKATETRDKIYFGYIFPISNPTEIEVTRFTKGKKLKGKLNLVKFLSTIETKSFVIGIANYSDENREEAYQKIVEVLQDQQTTESI